MALLVLMGIVLSHYTMTILRYLKQSRLAKIVSITKGAKIVVSKERICVRKAVSDMARYIDADRFKSNLEKAMEKMHLIGGVKGVDIGAVIQALDRQPTADVVPKSEVAREIIGIIDKRMEQKTEQCIGVRNEIVLGVYRGQLDAYRDVKEIIEQKYTEDKT